MDSLTFLNPMLLWGLALASIPLIIHLLFRRKFRRVEWAPMHYLKLSVQRNRRRVRLEQILLLLLRTAAIALLFFLVARPILHASGLGTWLTGRSRASQILILDDSLSMGHLENGHSAFERAQEIAASIVDSMKSSQDHLTLVVASRPRNPLLREVELTDAETPLKLIREARLSDSFVSWESTLPAIDELLEAGTYPIREVTIITDLRRAGWEQDLTELGNRWAGSRVRLRFFDVGGRQTENVHVSELEPVDPVALAGNPMRWNAVIHNGTTHDLEGAEANFFVDGKPSLMLLPSIPPGETARLPLVATFQESGLHHIFFELASDALRADDRAWSLVEVIDTLHAVVVDGEPSTEPLTGEVDFLTLAFSLGATDADSFRVEVISSNQWDWLMTTRPHLIVLANVANLDSNAADQLLRLVRSGVGLMIFPGDQIDPDNYNQLLFRQGEGLLPTALESFEEEDISGFTLDEAGGGPLAALNQLNPAVLSRIKVHKFARLNLPSELAPDVHLLARWNDAAGSPAVLEKVIDRGRVLFWTVTADKQWSNWPSDPTYVLTMREAAKALVRSDASAHCLRAGDPMRRSVSATHEVSSPEIEHPAAERPEPLSIDVSEPSKSPPTKALVCADTRTAGLYKLRWQDSQAGQLSDIFAVTPDTRESDLTPLTKEELLGKWGAIVPEVINASSTGDSPISVEGKEVWRNLAMGLMGLLLIEACFATWVGRQH